MKKLFGHKGDRQKDWEDYEEEAEYLSEEEGYEGEGEYLSEEEGYEEVSSWEESASESEAIESYEEGGFLSEQENYEGEAEYLSEQENYEGEGEYLSEEEGYEEVSSWEESASEPEAIEGYEESGCLSEQESYEESYEGEGEYLSEEEGYEEVSTWEESASEPEAIESYEEGGFLAEQEGYEGEAEYLAEEEGYEEEDGYFTEREERRGAVSKRKGSGAPRKQNRIAAMWQAFLDMSAMDRIITSTGVAVLVLALVTGSVYASAAVLDRQMDEFVTVGSQLDGMGLIGEDGLVAMADERRSGIAAASVVAEERKPVGYNEAEYGSEVTVALEMVSVLKDLKIKFINKATGKLIANVPFSVTVTDGNGASSTWTDEDMDGIIYQKELTPGSYSVAMLALTDAKYESYTLPTAAQKVEVKKDIAYKKVDVSNEVKKESEVNVAKEDTKKKDTAVESSLKDTVGWVESTSSSSTYTEVSKSTIPDPLTLAKSGAFRRVAAGRLTSAPAVSGGNASNVTVALDRTTATAYLTEPLALNVSVTGAEGAGDGALSVSSSDEGIATASVSGTAVTVNGVSEGSVTITVSYVQNGSEQKAACAVTVKKHPKNDTSTALKDAQGNPLYVQDGDGYRPAVYADYYTAEHFFISNGVKYTGWQTIDGSVYYFDSTGNKVTGEQVIQGAKYNFASDGSLVTGSGTMGIDVSKWNGSIDWNAVKNSGVSYVIIRCGYRGSSQGALIEDPKFASNIKGATAAGLKVGVYFFTQAVDEVEAVEEASMVLGQISGYRISYPIFLDVEPSGGRGDKIDKATRTAVCKAFCATIQSGGYTAGIYANKTWLNSKLDPGALSAYKIWLAQYAASPTYKGRYDLWQYKATGRVSGISGDVDMNISYLGY